MCEMTQKQVEGAVETLQQAIKDVETGRVLWFALSVKFLNGASYAIHSEQAPNRPRGVG